MTVEIWIVIGITVGTFSVYLLGRRPDTSGQQHEVFLTDIPKVYQSLGSTGRDGSFAMFVVPKRDSDEDNPHIQFSIENGVIGLDWVLESASNVRDSDKFMGILDKDSVPYRAQTMNDVSYIRTEDKRAPEICVSVLKAIYSLKGRSVLELDVDGFDWDQSSSGLRSSRVRYQFLDGSHSAFLKLIGAAALVSLAIVWGILLLAIRGII